jgi:hypothetical protein
MGLISLPPSSFVFMNPRAEVAKNRKNGSNFTSPV